LCAILKKHVLHLKTLLVNEGTNFTTFLGSRDVIGHVTITPADGWFPIGGPLTVDINPVSCTVSETLNLKYSGVDT